jgi:hypothetical protein
VHRGDAVRKGSSARFADIDSEQPGESNGKDKTVRQTSTRATWLKTCRRPHLVAFYQLGSHARKTPARVNLRGEDPAVSLADGP